MIFTDKVIIVTGGGRNPKGDPLPDVDNGPFRAQVDPLKSSESVAYGQPPLTRYYRLLIGKSGGDILTSTGKIKWRGRTMEVQGDVEPWVLQGRLHHFEATLKA